MTLVTRRNGRSVFETRLSGGNLAFDPGRAYLPAEGLAERARYLVPTSRELEGSDSRDGIVWEVLPPGYLAGDSR